MTWQCFYGHSLRITIIPTGERWSDGSLRPAVEDWISAGAIISQLHNKNLSPEAQAAVAAFQNAKPNIQSLLMQCGSGTWASNHEHRQGKKTDQWFVGATQAKVVRNAQATLKGVHSPWNRGR